MTFLERQVRDMVWEGKSWDEIQEWIIQQVGYDEGVLEEALVVYTKEEEKKKYMK